MNGNPSLDRSGKKKKKAAPNKQIPAHPITEKKKVGTRQQEQKKENTKIIYTAVRWAGQSGH
jgi:hypothetical protein